MLSQLLYNIVPEVLASAIKKRQREGERERRRKGGGVRERLKNKCIVGSAS